MRGLMRNQRGQIIIFVALSLVFLVVVAGTFGSDVSRLVSDKGELQASLDAAALAGAGKLGFDNTVSPTVRDFTVSMATKSTNRSGTVTLNRNDANDPNAFAGATPPYGDLLIGIWDPAKPKGVGAGLRFEPSLDGTRANAVACRYKRQVRASFLSLWGLVNMQVGAMAIATANPPELPPTECVIPVALSQCPFKTNNVFTSNGCGVAIKFITSSGNSDSTNTAGWVNLTGTGNPQPQDLVNEIQNAAAGGCNNNPPAVGTPVGVIGGQVDLAFKEMEKDFRTHFNASVATGQPYTLKDSTGHTVYTGYGWETWVPVVDSQCNADGTTKQLAGTGGSAPKVVGWTQFVMTQAWDPTGTNTSKIGQGCVVNNSADGATWPYCSMSQQQLPQSLKGGNGRAFWGIYSCTISPQPAVITPTPRSALATKLRLVQ